MQYTHPLAVSCQRPRSQRNSCAETRPLTTLVGNMRTVRRAISLQNSPYISGQMYTTGSWRLGVCHPRVLSSFVESCYLKRRATYTSNRYCCRTTLGHVVRNCLIGIIPTSTKCLSGYISGLGLWWTQNGDDTCRLYERSVGGVEGLRWWCVAPTKSAMI